MDKNDNGKLVKRTNRDWVGVYHHPHVLWITGANQGKMTVEYSDLLSSYDGAIPSTHMGYNTLTFDIKVTMKPRWVPHFLSMLKYMEQLGGLNSSRKVSFMADGNGDFRPRFEFPEELLPYRAEPVENEGGNKYYDAGQQEG